jgi:hypothetical protein
VQLPSRRSYGYGLMVDATQQGLSVISHGGSIKGVSSHVAVIPELGVTAVILANMDGFASEEAGFAAVETAAGLPLERGCVPTLKALAREFPEYHLDPARLGDYVGTYRSLDGNFGSVALAEGGLCIEIYGARFVTRPYGPDRFVADTEGRCFTFLRREGSVVSLFFGVRMLPKVEAAP